MIAGVLFELLPLGEALFPVLVLGLLLSASRAAGGDSEEGSLADAGPEVP